MPKSFLLFLYLITLDHLNAQTTISGSFLHGGITRTYSFYVPASYVPGNPVPLVFGLHGTSSSGAQFAQYRDFRPIADTANFIMVHPDGSTFLGIRFWNYGNVMGSTVDDVGFLEALIDTISASYSINPNRIYCTGMSNGNFMSYYLACRSNRFAAVGGVTGSMSVDMYNSCVPVRPTPTIHIHGTADPTNPYTGTSTMKAIEEVTRFWVMQNNCDTVPVITAVPNINTTDGATADRFLFSNGFNNHTIELFKVYGGEHTWPGSPMPLSSDVICMDFDARVEIWRFFSQYEISPLTVNETYTFNDIKIAPNPSTGILNILSYDFLISEIVVMDFQGRIIEIISNSNFRVLDLGHLKTGKYLLKISGPDFSVVRKLILLSEN